MCSLVAQTNLAADVQCYRSAADLLDAFHSGERFTLIFLDIEMEGKKPNGFQTARELKDAGNAALIVFVTVTSRYVYDGYEVAWRYVPKPILFKKVLELLVDAQRMTAPATIRFQTTEGLKTFHAKDICYIEVLRNTIHIHTEAADYCVYTTLKKAEEMLGSTLFVKPHMSFLVNGTYIDNIRNAEITLKSGDVIPIAQSRKGEFLDAYRNCIRSWS